MAASMNYFLSKLTLNFRRIPLSVFRNFEGNFNIHKIRSSGIPRITLIRYGLLESIPAGRIGTGLVGTSWAFFGLWKKKEEEQLSEHDQIRRIVSRGIVAKENRDFKEASKAYHEALSLSTDFLNDKKIEDKDHMNHRVFIYDMIANLAMDIGDYKNAEVVFKDTMKLALQLGMDENDNAMVEMSMKLASIYQYTGRDKLAVLGLTHCIAVQEEKIAAAEKKEVKLEENGSEDLKKLQKEENTKILLGKAYKHYANYYLQKGDFKSAEPLIVKSLDLSETHLGSEHDTTFVIMNDLATCQIMLKDFEKAEITLINGIRLSHKAGSLMEAAFCSNLGALYIRTNKLPQAEEACIKGIRVAEKGNDHYLMLPCKACLSKVAELRRKNVN